MRPGWALGLGLMLLAGVGQADELAAPDTPVDIPRPEREEPLFELGFGGVGTYGPDYPGSDEYSLNGLPFPFILYRGEVVKIGDDGAQVLPVQTDRFDISFSADGAFPANSDNTVARADMPDLDFLLQLGPEFVLKGPKFDNGRLKTEFALQGRAVFSTGLDDLRYRGMVFEPKARLSHQKLLGGRFGYYGSVSAVFATEKLHEYFYEVDPIYATPTREVFDAQSGYLGSELTFAAGYRLTERIRVFGGGSVNYHAGAANTDSPLYRSDLSGTVFVGFAVSFYTSKARAR